jgi:group I intron endonuclease
LRRGQGEGSMDRADLTRPSGIMEIWKAGGQEAVSAEALELVERIRVKARAFVAARSPRPSAIFRRSPRSGKVTGVVKQAAALDPVIYKITNLTNGRAYVGKAKDSYRRMWEHRTGKTMRGKKQGKLQLIDAKIKQYGWDNFKVEWLETNVDPAKLLDREAYWMRQCDTLVPKGYNILKPGVEVISMSDPEIRARWEAANPAGVLKSVECKREKREKRLEEIGGEQAEELRYRLEKEAGRNRKRHNGEALPPDGRLLPSAKRQATWARKLEERLSKMSPEDAKKARAKHDAQKKYAAANKEKVAAKDKAPKNQQYQKEYRAANKGKRLLLGRTADTSGWSAQGKEARK